MKKTNATAEIIMLEKLVGGDPKKALSNRKVRRAIESLRQAWSEDPKRFKSDLDELLLNTIRWSWPLRIYTPEEGRAKEEKLRAELERNRPNFVYADIPVQSRWLELLLTLRRRITEMLNILRRKTNETS